MLNAVKFSEPLSYLVLLYNFSFQQALKLYFFLYWLFASKYLFVRAESVATC